jgi:fructose-bisphosphate aldolase class II
LAEIREAVDYGVVKMNIDTDTQYAFTRPIADHMFKNYDGVLKVDGEVGRKKAYDPRTYLAAAEKAMAERVKQAVKDLRGEGTSLFKR